MPLPRVIPALADLTQDIAGPLPLTLLQAWAAGTQDVDTAGALLRSFRSAAAGVLNLPASNRFQTTISGIALTGVFI
jgi:hypothetical protein